MATDLPTIAAILDSRIETLRLHLDALDEESKSVRAEIEEIQEVSNQLCKLAVQKTKAPTVVEEYVEQPFKGNLQGKIMVNADGSSIIFSDLRLTLTSGQVSTGKTVVRGSVMVYPIKNSVAMTLDLKKADSGRGQAKSDRHDTYATNGSFSYDRSGYIAPSLILASSTTKVAFADLKQEYSGVLDFRKLPECTIVSGHLVLDDSAGAVGGNVGTPLKI